MLSFFTVFFKIFFYVAISLFVLIVIARIAGSKANKSLEFLKNKSEQKSFRIYFLVIGTLLGLVTSLFIPDTHLFVDNSIAHLIGGVGGGFIISSAYLAVMNQLYQYLVDNKD